MTILYFIDNSPSVTIPKLKENNLKILKHATVLFVGITF